MSNINGIDIDHPINTVCSIDTMPKLAHTFASSMPKLTSAFLILSWSVNTLKHTTIVHRVISVQHVRKFENVYLIDFVKLH